MELNNYAVSFVGDRVIKITYDPLVQSLHKPITVREFLYGLNKYIICYLANSKGLFAFYCRFINPCFKLMYFDKRSNELYLRISGIYDVDVDQDLDDKARDTIINSILLYIRTCYITEDNEK